MTDQVVKTRPASRLGFGTYRWAGTHEHVAALRRALEVGCTLIDTAPNYAESDVRRQLGGVLAPHRADVHIISKGGYTADGGFSLDPDFIRNRIRTEAELVGGGYLDTFLLHNPEHLLGEFEPGQVMEEIYRAFSVCVEQMSVGTIRSFGISSNVVATAAHPMGQDRVDDYVRLARELGAGDAFRYLQFPHNLVEDAALGNHWLARCRALGITTIGNRPLSPRTPSGPARIADAPVERIRPSAELLEELNRHRHGLHRLMSHWDQVASSDALDFVESLLSDALKEPHNAAVTRIVGDLVAAKRLELRHTASAHTTALMELPDIQERLLGDSRSSIVLRACQTYLRDVDHVLVGFRRTADVEQLAELFRATASRTA